jgi:hypothetical protein
MKEEHIGDDLYASTAVGLAERPEFASQRGTRLTAAGVFEFFRSAPRAELLLVTRASCLRT